MILKTRDNTPGTFDRPSQETVEADLRGQLLELNKLRLRLAPDAGSFALAQRQGTRDSLPRRSRDDSACGST